MRAGKPTLYAPVSKSETKKLTYSISNVPDFAWFADKKFAISDLEKACPGVSRDMIRNVMNRLRKQGRLKILGRGRDAKWAKLK